MFEQVKDYKSACKVLGIKPISTWYNWWYIKWERIIDGSIAGFSGLSSGDGINGTYSYTDAHLRFISRDAAEYAAKTFRPLYMKHMFGID